MEDHIKWGILSTAKIGLKHVIPGIQAGESGEVTAIASRSIDKAEVAAASLGIDKAYGSYEELLEDPDVNCIYNPLPNSLHMEWTIKAMEAGKHVLCEKPAGLSAGEVEEMIRVRDRTGLKAGEAFMVRSHPQWIETRERVRRGELGEPRLIQGMFSYCNLDQANIRNIPELGGGGMWDIGCYCTMLSAYLFEEQPIRLVSSLEFDPGMKTDRLSSVIMEFPSGHSVFSVSTQLVPYQRMHLFGTKGHIEVRIPFNAPNHRECTVAQDKGNILLDEVTIHRYPVVDQYTLMSDAFSKAILTDGKVPVSLEDALNNTKVLTAIFNSSKTGQWVEVH